jgi:hypothetical protein
MGWIVLALATASTAVAGASAASLGGGSSTTLVAIDEAAAASTPTVLGCDNFTGITGASMTGRVVVSAGACSSRVWTTHIGTWTIQANRAASSATTSANATVDTASPEATVQTVLTAINTGGRSGGLVLAHDGTATYLAAVMTDATPDRIELRLVDAGVSTVLAAANPTFVATDTLQLSRSGSSVTVTLNGALIVASSLDAAQLTTLGTNGRAGLFGGSTGVRFDDFVVTNP